MASTVAALKPALGELGVPQGFAAVLLADLLHLDAREPHLGAFEELVLVVVLQLGVLEVEGEAIVGFGHERADLRLVFGLHLEDRLAREGLFLAFAVELGLVLHVQRELLAGEDRLEVRVLALEAARVRQPQLLLHQLLPLLLLALVRRAQQLPETLQLVQLVFQAPLRVPLETLP